VIGDTIPFQGKCVWSDTDGNKIFTEWSGKCSASTGTGDGPKSITGGTGKFSGIEGAAPFQGQALNDKVNLTVPSNGAINWLQSETSEPG
jgi:hypothetical protein